MTEQHCIYVISAGDDFHKIGISRDPQARLRDLQTAHFQELEWTAFAPLDKSLAREAERHAHAALAAKRVRGEWFNCSLDEAGDALERGFYRAHGVESDPYVWRSPKEEALEARIAELEAENAKLRADAQATTERRTRNRDRMAARRAAGARP